MARVSVCGISPASSTGSPTTFMIRPSVPSPTGIAIGVPVSTTSCPRTSPSLVSIATVRTVFSPSCWATSSTSRRPWFCVSRALRIGGRSSSKCTSTTGPMTWVMRPTALAIRRPTLPRRRSQRLGSRDDLYQFLGDHGLTRPVIEQRLAPDHVACVARGIIHCRHLRAVERRGILQKRAEYLHGQIARQQIVKNVLSLGFEFIHGAVKRFGGLGVKDRRDDLLLRRNLSDNRAEPRIKQGADIKFEFVEQSDDFARDHLRMFEM